MDSLLIDKNRNSLDDHKPNSKEEETRKKKKKRQKHKKKKKEKKRLISVNLPSPSNIACSIILNILEWFTFVAFTGFSCTKLEGFSLRMFTQHKMTNRGMTFSQQHKISFKRQ